MKTMRAGCVAVAALCLLGCGGGSASHGWVRDVASTSASSGSDVAAYADGTSVLVGRFEGTCTFGQGEVHQTVLTSDGQTDGFVARHGSDGNLLWARRLGGSSFDGVNGAGRVDDGTCLVTGQFVGSAVFGPGEPHETTLVAEGPSDMDAFVARYAEDGSLMWVRRIGGIGSANGKDVAEVGSGILVVTGSFDGSAVFAPGTPGETTLTSAGGMDVFFAEYDLDGDLAWARQAGGAADDDGRGVAALGSGAFVVTGEFMGTATFGPGEAGQTVFTADGAYDFFVARCAPDGSLAWVRRSNGASFAEGFAVAGFADGSSVVTGRFGGDATFGATEIGETTLSADGEDDLFVARYAQDGSLAWARRAGGLGHDVGLGVAALSSGACVVTGSFQLDATFGRGQPNQVTLTAAGTGDVLLARYDAGGNLEWAHHVAVSNLGAGDGVSAFPDGSFVVGGFYGTTATFAPGEPGETTLTAGGPQAAFIAGYKADGGL